MSIPPVAPVYTTGKLLNEEFLNNKDNEEIQFHEFNTTKIWDSVTRKYLVTNIMTVTMRDENTTFDAMVVSIHKDGIIVFPRGYIPRAVLSNKLVFQERSSGGSTDGLDEDGELFGWSPLYRPDKAPSSDKFTTSFPCIMFNTIKNVDLDNSRTTKAYISLNGEFSRKDSNIWEFPNDVAGFMNEQADQDGLSLQDGLSGAFTKPSSAVINLEENPFLPLTYVGRKPSIGGEPFSNFDDSVNIYSQINTGKEIKLDPSYPYGPYVVRQREFIKYVSSQTSDMKMSSQVIMKILSITGPEGQLIVPVSSMLLPKKEGGDDKDKDKDKDKDNGNGSGQGTKEDEPPLGDDDEEDEYGGKGNYSGDQESHTQGSHHDIVLLIDLLNRDEEILRRKFQLKNSLRHDSEQRMMLDIEIKKMEIDISIKRAKIVEKYSAMIEK